MPPVYEQCPTIFSCVFEDAWSLVEWKSVGFTVCVWMVTFLFTYRSGKSRARTRLWLATKKSLTVTVAAGMLAAIFVAFGYSPWHRYVALKEYAQETIADRDKTVGDLQAKLKEQPKVIYRTSPNAPSESEVERRKKQQIKEQVAKYMVEGQALRPKYLTQAPIEELLAEKGQWERRVEKYLLEQLDSSYVARFRNPGDAPASYPEGIRLKVAGTWADIGMKVGMLGKFIEELNR